MFPYLPEMIESFGVPKNEIAKWAGAASAIFSLGQCLTSIFWGRASDTYGRKKVILLGLFNTMVTSLVWGFSTSLPMALVARAIQGAGNGNVGILRTMVAELCPWKVRTAPSRNRLLAHNLGPGTATESFQYHAFGLQHRECLRPGTRPLHPANRLTY